MSFWLSCHLAWISRQPLLHRLDAGFPGFFATGDFLIFGFEVGDQILHRAQRGNGAAQR